MINVKMEERSRTAAAFYAPLLCRRYYRQADSKPSGFSHFRTAGAAFSGLAETIRRTDISADYS
jgi:hypothetical protein